MTYAYDNADRPTSTTQNSATVGSTYDDGDRRTVLTLPNLTVEYDYDAASRVIGLTYKLGHDDVGQPHLRVQTQPAIGRLSAVHVRERACRRRRLGAFAVSGSQ